MATIKPASQALLENTAYNLVRRAQAKIAAYRNFGNGDLAMYLDRNSFEIMSERLAKKYFHKSSDLMIFEHVKELFKVAMILAPILQRIAYSSKYDWHRGHVMSWFRANISSRRKRFHLSITDSSRTYDPVLLGIRLEALGIRDASMVAVLMDIYRRHSEGTTLQNILAYQIFDPIMFTNAAGDFLLRHGAHVYRMEKNCSADSIDLRTQSATVLDYQIKALKQNERHFLEITISDVCLKEFKDDIKRLLSFSCAPDVKVERLKTCIRDLVERTRPARSAYPQIIQLKLWLAAKLKHLSATIKDAGNLPNLLVNRWLSRVDGKFYVKSANMFYNPKTYDEEKFTVFFSPYREV